jgi:hypothetical protein
MGPVVIVAREPPERDEPPQAVRARRTLNIMKCFIKLPVVVKDRPGLFGVTLFDCLRVL